MYLISVAEFHFHNVILVRNYYGISVKIGSDSRLRNLSMDRHVFCQTRVGNNNQFDVFSMKKIAKRGICIESAITSVSVPSMFINIKDKIVPIFVANWCGLQIQLSTNFVYKINIKLSYCTVLTKPCYQYRFTVPEITF